MAKQWHTMQQINSLATVKHRHLILNLDTLMLNSTLYEASFRHAYRFFGQDPGREDSFWEIMQKIARDSKTKHSSKKTSASDHNRMIINLGEMDKEYFSGLVREMSNDIDCSSHGP